MIFFFLPFWLSLTLLLFVFLQLTPFYLSLAWSHKDNSFRNILQVKWTGILRRLYFGTKPVHKVCTWFFDLVCHSESLRQDIRIRIKFVRLFLVYFEFWILCFCKLLYEFDNLTFHFLLVPLNDITSYHFRLTLNS